MKRILRKKWLLYGGVAVLLLSLGTQISFPECSTLRSYVHHFGIWSPIVFFAFSIVAMVLLLPRTPLVLIAGVCFGGGWGGTLSLVSSVIAGWICFKLEERKGKSLEGWLSEQNWFKAVEHFAEDKQFFLVLSLRLMHVVHFSLSSYALALTKISTSNFIWGTVLGLAPGTFAVTYLADSLGCQALSGIENFPKDMQIKLAVSFGLLTIVSLLPLLLKTYFSKNKRWTSGRIHVQAHRGASQEFQENTLPAFARAIEVEADSIELDVHVTKDNQIVVYHDFVLEPAICERDGKPLTKAIAIRDINYSELIQYDCKPSRLLKQPNTLTVAERRIPLLSEVFQLFKNSPLPHAKKMLIDIELKSDPAHPEWTPKPRVFLKLVFNLLKSDWEFSRTVIRSFDPRLTLLARWRGRRKLFKVVQLTNGGFVDYDRVIRKIKPQVIAPNHATIQLEHIQKIHKAYIEVMPWTANTAAEWQRLVDLKVDGITTDNPKGLIEFLKNK